MLSFLGKFIVCQHFSIGFVGLNDFFEGAVFFGVGAEFFLVVDDFGVGQGDAYLLESGFDGI
jgi:hypothetical protein